MTREIVEQINMYLEHFGLCRRPFKITPDTSLFYKGNKRGASLEALKYAIESGEGIVKVIGEVGSGKTMLCRMLEQELPSRIEIVYIANPSLSPENILPLIAFELNLDIENIDNKLKVMQQLQTYLLEKHANNKQVLVLVEEAQSMPVETLEEIRLLSNLETNDDKLLQMILFGQPELDEKLKLKNIRQLKERITHSFYLEPFNNDDIYQYLNYRMHAVGYRGPEIFSEKIISTISKESQGLTRRLNILADKALLAVYAEGAHELQKKHIKMAVQDSEFSFKQNNKLQKILWAVPILMLLSIWVGMQIAAYNSTKYKPESTVSISSVNKINEDKKREYEKTYVNINEIASATEAWLRTVDDGSIVIQLLLMNKSGVKNFIHRYKNKIDINAVHVYAMTLKGKKIYSLIYGGYENKKLASAVLVDLDSEIKKNGAYLRSIKGIKYDIKKSKGTLGAGF